MYKVLLLFWALLLLGSAEPAQAARPTAYVRALRKGRVYVHRPNYKLYKARWHRRGPGLSRLLPQARKARPTATRSRI
jgi:hypothetical protein